MSAESATGWSAVDALLARAVVDGVVSGAAICVRSVGAVLHSAVAGLAERRPVVRPVFPGTAWDLASLTKVLATTPVAMALTEDGFDLDAPLTEVLPGAPAGVTAAHCLSHTSGLPAWTPLWEQVDGPWGAESTRRAVLDAVFLQSPEAAPGASHCYSDLGFLLLGAALEAAGGDRLDRLWERRVRSTSDADLRWGWAGAAATEDCPVRGSVVVGTVHDLNAALMGGIAPHAGLFGSAESVAAAAAWQLRCARGSGEGLQPATVRRFWTHRGAGSHHLGWDGVSQPSSASERWPADGVGHLGFTGCSVWIAPQQGVVVALLSNRVHPLVEGGSRPGAPVGPRLAAFRQLRPAIHRAVVETLERSGRWCGM